MASIIQLRRDISINWLSVNPILASGEVGLELDTNKFKFGDGVTRWASLPYPTWESLINAVFNTLLVTDYGDVALYGDGSNTSTLTFGAGSSYISGTNTGDQTNIAGNAGTVTNATFITHLTTDTGSIIIHGNTNGSVLTIGYGNNSISGTNTGDQIIPTGGTPNLTLGMSNSSGSSLNFLRTDDSILVFDSIPSSTLNFGNSASTGTSTTAARRDHIHAMPPTPVNVTGNAGTVTNATFNTRLIVNTGNIVLQGDTSNSSVLTIGSGNNSISGINTGDQTGGTPSLTLGISNSAGSSPHFLRNDDTILVFDTSLPSTLNFGNSASVGVATVAARRDHIHSMPVAPTPSNIGAVATTFQINGNQLSGTSLTLTPTMVGSPLGSGTSTGTNTGDQIIPTGGTPNLTLGISNSAGSSPHFLRNDDTILVFDTTVPSTLAFNGNGYVGSANTVARRDHVHTMPSIPTPSMIGSVATTFTINGYQLSGSNITLNAVSVNAVPNTFQLNGNQLSGTSLTLTPSMIGSPSISLTINGHSLSSNITINSNDTGSVSTTFTINGSTLSGTSLTLTPTIIGSPSGSGTSTGTNTGDQTGGTPALTLGTVNSPGVSSSFIRRDDTILIFDTVSPASLTFGDTAVVGIATTAARRDHVHPIPIAPTLSSLGGVATTFTINGNQLSGTSLTLTPSMIGSPSTNLTINGNTLSENITLNSTNTGSVATTFTINGNQLSGTSLTLTPSMIGSPSTNLTINGNTLSNNINLIASNVGAVSTSFNLNGNQLTGTSLTLTPSMIGSPSGSGTSTGINTGDQIIPIGGTPNLTLGTSNIPGSSSNFLRRDDTILVFDVTSPSTQNFGNSASVGVATVAARRDHIHGMPSMPTPSMIGSVATTFTINGSTLSGTSLTLNASSVGAVASNITINGQSLTSNVTLTPSMIGSPSTSLTINGNTLTSNISITPSNIGAISTNLTINGTQIGTSTNITLNASSIGGVATTFQINGNTLSGTSLTLTPAMIGSPGTSLTINGNTLTSNISITPSNIGAVATTFTINGNQLSGTSLTLTPTIIGSPSGSGTSTGINTGDQTGGTPNLTLGTSNSPGVSSNFLRRDDTILVFDATVPSTLAFGNSASVGIATVAARRDHSHGMPSMPTPSMIGSVATTFTINGNQLSGTSLTLTPSMVGSPSGSGTSTGTNTGDQTLSGLGGVATTFQINGSVMSGTGLTTFDSITPASLIFGNSGSIGVAVTAARRDHVHQIPIAPTLSSLGGVATTFTINGNQLSGTSLTLTPSIIGSPSTSLTINGNTLTSNITLTSNSVGAVATTFTLNGNQLSGTSLTLTPTMIGSPSGSGTSTGTNTGDQTLSSLGGIPNTFILNGNALSGTSLTLTPSMIGSPATSFTINGHTLNSNITITNSDVGSVATNFQINGNTLSGTSLTLTPSMIGSPSTSLTINGNTLTSNISITPSNIGAVATTFQINGNQLSGTSLTLTPSMIGSPSGSGTSTGINTGDQIVPTGGIPNLTLGTSNSAGVSSNFLRRDDTILVFDATVPSTLAFGSSASIGSASVAARRDHSHGMPSMPTPSQIGSVATTFTINGNQLSGTSLTLTPSMIGSPSTSLTINGQLLTGNITLTPSMIGSPSTSLTINGNTLTSNISITPSNIGAVATTFTINGNQLSGTGLTLNASSVGAVASNITINGQSLTNNVTLNASNVNAVPNTFNLNGNVLSGTGLTLTPSIIGSPSTNLTINGHNLGNNVIISSSDVGAVATTFQINGNVLFGSSLTLNSASVNAVPNSFTLNGNVLSGSTLNLTPSMIGSPSTSLTINGNTLTSNISITPSNIGAVATTFTINGNQLSGTSLTLNAASVNAVSTSFTINGQSLSGTGITTYGSSIPSSLSFGNSASAGSSTNVARIDHIHAIPSIPNASQVGAVATTFTLNGNQLSGTGLTLTPAMIGSPSTNITINGQSLNSNVTITDITGNAGTVTNATFTTHLTVNTGSVYLEGSDQNNSVLVIGSGANVVSGVNTGDQTIAGIGGVATSFTINGNQLSGTSLTLNASNIGALATTLSINGTVVGNSTNISINASSVGAVATTFQINGNSLSGTSLTLNASSIGAFATNISINGVVVAGSTASNLNISASAMSVYGAAAATTLTTGTDNTQYATAYSLNQAGVIYGASPIAIGTVTPNIVVSLNKEVYFTASGALTSALCSGTIVSNYGMSLANCTMVLPTASSGLSFVAVLPTVVAYYVRFQAGLSDAIYLNGVAGAVNGAVGVNSGYLTMTQCTFFCTKNSSGGFSWCANPIYGTWVVI